MVLLSQVAPFKIKSDSLKQELTKNNLKQKSILVERVKTGTRFLWVQIVVANNNCFWKDFF